MIRVDNVSKCYGHIRAVDGVSFHVKVGEIMGFVGPNAAGKSTTMRIITGFLEPDHGTVYVGDIDVRKDSMAVRRMIGYLPENNPLYGDLTTRDYLVYMAKLRGVPKEERRSVIPAILERCHINTVADQLIGTLSKGYRQRVGVAQALVHSPKVLILDEPTVGLDPRQILDTCELVRDLAGDHTVILSTHILQHVMLTCHSVTIISEGKICASGTIEEVVSKPPESGETVLLVRAHGSEDRVQGALQSVAGVKQVESQRSVEGKALYDVRIEFQGRSHDDLTAELTKVLEQRQLRVLEIGPSLSPLEEIYLQLTRTAEEVVAQ